MSADMVECCPECGSSNVSVRSPGSMSSPRSQTTDFPRYRCADCRARFDTLEEREPIQMGGGSPIRKSLLDANPEDWP